MFLNGNIKTAVIHNSNASNTNNNGSANHNNNDGNNDHNDNNINNSSSNTVAAKVTATVMTSYCHTKLSTQKELYWVLR